MHYNGQREQAKQREHAKISDRQNYEAQILRKFT
jgi:hypothetical protein